MNEPEKEVTAAAVVSLREITNETLGAVLRLKVKPDQLLVCLPAAFLYQLVQPCSHTECSMSCCTWRFQASCT